MIRRTIDFTAKADGGVTPAIPVFGGVKGEHNATQIRITLDSGIYEDGDPVRLCFTTGDGTVLSSDLLDNMEVQGDKVVLTYTLGELLTVAAHQLCVRVVISRLNDSGNETQRWRSGEMVLYFETSSVENGTPFWTGVSEMLARTVSAKDTATADAKEAQSAKDDALSAKDTATAAAKEVQSAKDDALSAKDTALTAAARAEGFRSTAYGYAVEAAASASSAAQSATAAGAAAQEAAAEAVAELGSDIETLKTDTGNIKERLETVEYDLEQVDSMTSGLAGEIYNHRTVMAFLKNTTLKYKGSTASGTQLSVVDKEVGDVWYVGNEQAFFMWDGEFWKPLATGSGGNVSGGAGWTSAQIALLETIGNYLVFTDASTGQQMFDALIASLRKNASEGGNSGGNGDNGDGGESGGNTGGDDSGEQPTDAFTVTNSFTNVSTDNTSTTVANGSSYTAILTADSGYYIGSISVTMGGVNITATAYADGVINIPEVTGNIVIVVSGTASDNILTAEILAQSGKGSLTDGSNVDGVTYVVTPFIEVEAGATYFTNMDSTLPDGTNTYLNKIEWYREDRSHIATGNYTLYKHNSNGMYYVTAHDGAKFAKIIVSTQWTNPYIGKSGVAV